MVLRAYQLGLAFAVFLGGLVFSTGVVCAAADYSLVNQGWRIVEQEGKRTVELSALVVNDSELPLQYEVRFIVECSERPARTRRACHQPGTEGSRPTEPVWTAVQTISVRGGPLAPGVSALVKGTVPYELLEPGKVYRYRAELVDVSTGTTLARTTITSLGSPFLAAAALVGAAFVASELLGDEGAPTRASGSGIMTGQHEARRVGGEWVEHGSGTIDLRTSQGRMILNYTYDARGASAASLIATATATGQLVRLGGPPLPVVVTSASARMTFPGARQQTGQVIRRTGATATGTFSGTVGGQPWSGLLTMTKGTQTLNLATDKGMHKFDIQFTASR